jgi:mono/diheme cytochrome c family protein
MSDFVHDGWSLYIAIITLASLVACAVLLKMMSTRKMAPGEKPGTTGHVWDEDLQEWHNPLPSWWMWLFYITIVFALVYLILYPGLGSYKGYLGWTSTGQYQDEQKQAAATYGPIIDKFLKQDVQTVAANPEAREIGQRLFLNYCAQCHGSDAGGSKGYPNLRDNDWLYGGTPEAIKTTLLNGRNGAMLHGQHRLAFITGELHGARLRLHDLPQWIFRKNLELVASPVAVATLDQSVLYVQGAIPLGAREKRRRGFHGAFERTAHDSIDGQSV